MGMPLDMSGDSEDYEVQVEKVNIMLIERYSEAAREGRSILYMGGEAVQCNLSVAELDALLIK